MKADFNQYTTKLYMSLLIYVLNHLGDDESVADIHKIEEKRREYGRRVVINLPNFEKEIKGALRRVYNRYREEPLEEEETRSYH